MSRRPQWRVHPQSGTWRWWSGHHWTQYEHADAKKPVLPPFLSIPVLVFLLLDVGLYLVWGVDPFLLGLAFAPTLLVLAFLLFIDRVSPEPAEGRWHAFLWGAFVAGFVTAEVNGFVDATFGEYATYLIAAPLGEELLKGAGVLWAVRRGEIEDALDGAIYAGWVAVGFTVMEDYVYYLIAVDQGELVETIIGRTFGTFAHPLFTIFIGLAVGRAVAENQDLRSAFLKGLAVAVGLHALWNLSTFAPFFIVVLIAFLALAGFTVEYLRRNEQQFRHDVAGAARVIARAAANSPLSPTALRTLQQASDPDAAWALRQSLPRRSRRALDAERAAIVRLMLRARRAGVIYPAEILTLSGHLTEIDRLARGTGPGPSDPGRPRIDVGGGR
jgi:RsiW-degrading membrane proteinase PrsW (M82 family)